MKTREPWWDRLNRSLLPFMGPAQVGPYEDTPPPSTAKSACPLCGAPMDAHTFDRVAGATTKLHCPVVSPAAGA
jgi:hypothetical protein